MAMTDDTRLEEARAIPVAEVAHRLDIRGLKPAGRERVGPCPACGGKDRFSINPDLGVFNCRHCGGGDGVRLVELVLACDFKAALAWLVGEAEREIDPEVRRQREEARERDKVEAERVAERKRAEAVSAARAIWDAAVPAVGSPVVDYLRLRGLPDALASNPPPCLRYTPALPYMIPAEGRGWQEAHRGPAMLAAIQLPGGGFSAVHRTWFDLDRPQGKARIEHDGEILDRKKSLGSKKGCAIRLTHHRPRPGDFDTLVMGEGIETTLTALAADALPGAAYWAGIDLGNMAGRRVLRGKGMKYAGIPDLEDDTAFLPPPWIRRLVFIQDGDSDPRVTRAQLLSGLRRARARIRGLDSISIVHPGEGQDLNDILTRDPQ